ncbi:hypothetical protein TNCV_2675611 [Trichonephila clavipes]|nr:hypothetical protein TNCV_2675611 [Trichonephila clavipes]
MYTLATPMLQAAWTLGGPKLDYAKYVLGFGAQNLRLLGALIFSVTPLHIAYVYTRTNSNPVANMQSPRPRHKPYRPTAAF